MRTIWNIIIDFIFPPSKEAVLLRSLKVENIFTEFPPAPAVPYSFITSLFAYKHALVSQLIWNIKYKKDRHSISLGAYALYEELKEMGNEMTILIPIPVSKKRRRERGYNQCELLINEILKLDKENKIEKRFDILIRKKHTGKQTLKNRKDRIESSGDIFTAKPSDMKNTIIIIDDVATTGSTLKEARETLLQAGYENVRALTLAH